MRVHGATVFSAVLALAGCHLLVPNTPPEPAPEAGADRGPDLPPPDRSVTVTDHKVQPADKKVQPADKKVQPVDKKAQPKDKATLQCGKGKTMCGKACVDLETDLQNCGGCGKKCNDANPCTTDTCSKGKCNYSAKKAGTACSGGVCGYKGTSITCCTGCLDGTTCRAGTTNGHCGKSGTLCTNCTKNRAKKVCDGKTGKCTLGTTTGCMWPCTTGCCKGNLCAAGTANNMCGKDNTPCVDCTKKAAPDCHEYYCAPSRECDTRYKPKGSSCTGGKCCTGVCQNHYNCP